MVFLLMQFNIAYLRIFVYMCIFGITYLSNAFSTTVARSNFDVWEHFTKTISIKGLKILKF